ADIAGSGGLRLPEGIGAGSARRVLDPLRPADPGPFARWPDAAAAAPRRARDDLTATVTSLADAAAQEHTPQRATAILAALDGPLRARYPDADIRLADLERLADAAASRPSLHDALVELAPGPPRPPPGPPGAPPP